jgi:hypothetical protein
LKKVMPFVITADHKPAQVGGKNWAAAIQPARQMEFFSPEPSVFTGQL